VNAPPDCQHPVRLLLPWAVSGRLEDGDAQQFREHLADCAECRAELKAERRLVERLIDDGNLEYAPAASLQKFMNRLDRLETDERSLHASRRTLPRTLSAISAATRRSGLRPLVLAMTAMQTAAIVLLGILLARPFAPADYTTLAEPAPVPGRAALRVLFVPELPVGELPALLGRIGAEIAYGPSESGVYTLVLGPGRSPEAALASLRSDARIRFAEPIPGAGPRASP
jgi:anti-sigma factor RsiW